jgi:hypothetical protein
LTVEKADCSEAPGVLSGPGPPYSAREVPQFVHPETDRADFDGDQPVARIQLSYPILEGTLRFTGGAQDRKRATVTAGTVDLPPDRFMI